MPPSWKGLMDSGEAIWEGDMRSWWLGERPGVMRPGVMPAPGPHPASSTSA